MKPLFKISVIVILLFGTTIYLPSCKKEATPPIVITTIVSDITKTTASIGGTVTSDGGSEIIVFGVCWSTSPNPTVSSNKTSYNAGIGSYTSMITGLTENTTYYVRAYATNSAGTSYGNEISFKTNQVNKGSTVPTLTTTIVTSITSTSAISGGNITDDGGGDITSRGIYWNRTPDSDIYPDEVTTDGSGTGSFVSNLSNLSPGTTYYVKAYAVNGVGIAFGPTLSFTTSIEQGGTWIRKADFPGGQRVSAASFSIGTKMYLGLGWDDGDNPRIDFWEWDQATNVWTRKADFPGFAEGSFVWFSIGTKGYIGTSGNVYTNDFTTKFWEYDPAGNSWIQKASLPITPSRYGAVGFSIGTKGYIGIGGKSGFISDPYYKDFWEWDQETNIWTQKADFPGNTRAAAVGFSIGNKGYIGTGYDGTNNSKEFWEWDQATNVWTRRADFGGTSRSYAVGFSIGNKGYLGTGGLLKDFWEWDQATNVWTPKANFGGPARNGAVGVSIGDKGYIGTGMNGNGQPYAFMDLWEYEPNLK
jgi:N-acetylneuraminic acid mutarotase